MKVLLIYPVNNRPAHILPLGLGYLGAVLGQEGYKVKALDTDAYRFSRREMWKLLRETEYDGVGCVHCLSW